MSEKILIIDDEQDIADLLEVYLKNENYVVYKFYCATDAMSCIESGDIDLAILDIMLPDMNGFSLCQLIRKKYIYPIIMLTAKIEETDKITGLTLGADDYVTKPFGMMELVSRIKAVLRRSKGSQERENPEIQGVHIDVKKHEVTVDGRTVPLTLKEFELLEKLMRNEGIVLTRDQLLTEIWGYDFDGETRTVDVHIRTLRQKLGEKGEIIQTVRGVGYRIGGSA